MSWKFNDIRIVAEEKGKRCLKTSGAKPFGPRSRKHADIFPPILLPC